MNKDQREIQRKLRILRYAAEIGHVAKACRYFGKRRLVRISLTPPLICFIYH